MKTNNGVIAILLSIVFIACNTKKPSDLSRNIGTKDIAVENLKSEEKNTTLEVADSSTTMQSLPLNGTQSNTQWDKNIIKNAQVTLELKEFDSYNKNIHARLRNYGAYIASEQQNEIDSKQQNVMVIKVPVANFEDLMNTLPAEGAKVLERNISTQDVTGEVVDTKSRTETKKQVRDRYLSLLKSAKNMKEILQVQKEINTMEEDIDAGSSRSEFLVHQSAYSTINLTYFQYLNVGTEPDPTPTFFSRLKNAFNDGSSIVKGLLVFIVSFWPLILGGSLVWIFIKRIRIIRTK